MTKYDFDFLVFIGRFQPLHMAHVDIIREALRKSKRVIVLVGSANNSGDIRNPFSFEQRQIWIENVFREQDSRLFVLPLNDHTYNLNAWIEEVHKQVNSVTWHYKTSKGLKIGLIGRNKDHASYYLKLFPEWGSVNFSYEKILNLSVEEFDPYHLRLSNLGATELRQELFERTKALNEYSKLSVAQKVIRKEKDRLLLERFVPGRVYDDLVSGVDFVNKTEFTPWIETEEFKNLKAEYEYIKEYKKKWDNVPYPPTFTTVDAVVVQSGYILLVKRKAHPGKGKWALPGGFLNQNETLLEGCLRELKEETKIKIPRNVLLGSLKAQKTFDDVHRDPRGRFLTTAFLFNLEPQIDLPQVKAASDAADVKWVPLAELEPNDLFIDHYFIIDNMTASL